MNFSVTERQNAKRCPRMHRLSSKGGRHLGLIVPPAYLGCGSLIHKASQNWLENPAINYETHVMMAAESMIERAKEKYFRQVGARISAEEEQPLYEALHFARVMASNYQLRWGAPLPEGFTLVRAEQRVIVPVPGTEHPCELCGGYNPERDWGTTPCVVCKGDPGYVEYHYLDGRFDALIQDRAGRIHILEHKTYNSRPTQLGLDTNDQFLAYMWLAIQLGVGDIAGLDYDGLWRRDKVPKGRQFEDLFLRVTVTRTLAELQEFDRNLPNELNFMYAQLKADRDPWINRRWQGCYDCSFASKKNKDGYSREGLCDAMSRNQNVDAVLKLYYTERDDDIEGDDLEELESDAA